MESNYQRLKNNLFYMHGWQDCVTKTNNVIENGT